MDVIGTEMVALHDLHGFEGWSVILRSQFVAQLALSIRHEGLLHLPRVRTDGLVVDGRRRIAAMVKNKQFLFEVEVVTGDDDDVARERVAANCVRTVVSDGMRNAAVRELAELRKGHVKQIVSTKRKNLKKQTALRARKARTPKRNVVQPLKPPSKVMTSGPAEAMRRLQKHLAGVDEVATRLIAMASPLERSILPTQAYTQLELALHRIHKLCRASMPVGLCPQCNAVGKDCLRCNSVGYLTTD